MKTNQRLADEVAARLRAERARLNLTLREVGERSGIHFVTISRYEQGAIPTVDAVYRLARVYGVEAAAFFPPTAVAFDAPAAAPKAKGKGKG